MFIDSHAHLYVAEFQADRLEMIERARRAGVVKVVLPNIDEASVVNMFSICESHPDMLYPSVGLHPCSVRADYTNQLRTMEKYLEDERIVAIGETGIDLYWDKSLMAEQEQAFRIQINWAKELNLPIIIHSRESIEHTLRIIEEEQDGSLRGVFHCFSESQSIIDRVQNVHFMMGVGGVVSFKKMGAFRDLLKNIERSKVLLETDSPYLAPEPYRGKRNESAYIPIIARVLAESWELTVEETATITTANARSLFNI